MESLRQHFMGVATKCLSAVEATPRSNQHEIDSKALMQILGNPGERRIWEKYLFELAPAISIHQTSEIEAHGLRLVVPAQLHNTNNNAQGS